MAKLINTLDEIATEIAMRLDREFEFGTLNAIKLDVINTRALFVRREINKTRKIHEAFLQTFVTEVVPAKGYDPCKTVKFCQAPNVFVSKYEIPLPITVTNQPPFSYVGHADLLQPFNHSGRVRRNFMQFNRFNQDEELWDYIGRRIYIFNTPQIKNIGIQGAFAKPPSCKRMRQN